MNTSTMYTDSFFEQIDHGSLASARVIVPRILSVFHPLSVVDVGCGRGNFLAVFAELGVGDYLGVDGDYVDRTLLKIPIERFQPLELAAPVNIDRKFDLALSLEVAEHLPETAAETFVTFLTELAPIIVFSAAIPFQPGVNHVNCQWPDYWQSIFRRHGYAVIDPFRDELISDQRVEWWYAQNLLVAIRFQILESRPDLRRYLHEPVHRLVHPELYYFLMTSATANDQQLQATIAQVNGTITRLEDSLAERDADLLARDGQIASLNGAVAECGRQIATLNQSLAECNASLIDAGAALSECNFAMAKAREETVRTNHLLEALEVKLAKSNQRLQAMYSSRSWRITAPLRFLSRIVRWRS